MKVAAQADQLSLPAQSVALAINQARVNAGLAALSVHPLLNQAAQAHADDILANHNYSHQGSDGSFVKARVTRTGYGANPWVSENWVAARDAKSAMDWWMNDYIHRVNILAAHWREMGVGVATRPETGEMVFVTVFAAGPPSPAPTASQVAQPLAISTDGIEPDGMEYVIRPGDTLSTIAARYGLTWQNIAAANGLHAASVLQIGQVIRLPGVSAVLDPQAPETLANNPSTQADATVDAPVIDALYTVNAGDTLFNIASRHGLLWQELASINDLDENSLLQIGQALKIPRQVDDPLAATPLSVSSLQSPLYHTVEGGDTIVEIAMRYQVDWRSLLAINGLNETSVLQIGQQIRLR